RRRVDCRLLAPGAAHGIVLSGSGGRVRRTRSEFPGPRGVPDASRRGGGNQAAQRGRKPWRRRRGGHWGRRGAAASYEASSRCQLGSAPDRRGGESSGCYLSAVQMKYGVKGTERQVDRGWHGPARAPPMRTIATFNTTGTLPTLRVRQ